MSKKLNESAMRSELAGSAFFQASPANSPQGAGKPRKQSRAADGTTASHPDAEVDRNAAITQSRAHAIMPSQPPESAPEGEHPSSLPERHKEASVEAIRRAVKQLGKEETTYRLTSSEKKQLTDLVYSYASSGLRTSQNEITRIAVNFLLDDYKRDPENSMLVRVMDRLNE